MKFSGARKTVPKLILHFKFHSILPPCLTEDYVALHLVWLPSVSPPLFPLSSTWLWSSVEIEREMQNRFFVIESAFEHPIGSSRGPQAQRLMEGWKRGEVLSRIDIDLKRSWSLIDLYIFCLCLLLFFRWEVTKRAPKAMSSTKWFDLRHCACKNMLLARKHN